MRQTTLKKTDIEIPSFIFIGKIFVKPMTPAFAAL